MVSKYAHTCIKVGYDWKNASFYLVLVGGAIVAVGVVVTSIGEDSIEQMEEMMGACLCKFACLGTTLIVTCGFGGSCGLGRSCDACAQVNGKCN